MTEVTENKKRVTLLDDVKDMEYATALKAQESWTMFSIMSEFVETTEKLSEVQAAVTIFGSARIRPGNPYYDKCVEMARKLSDAGFAVFSGGGPGIMEAANKGAYEGASPSVGLNIELPFEQASNQWQNVTVNYRHFFARKTGLIKYANAFICFPGGYGTLDEMSEVLTLVQTNKVRQFPIILFGRKFWQGFMDWSINTLLEEGMVSEKDVHLMTVTDDVDFALNHIISYYKDRNITMTSAERLKMMYL